MQKDIVTSEDSRKYYKGELNKVSMVIPETKFKIISPSGYTKWINLNNDSANVLAKFLRDHFEIEN